MIQLQLQQSWHRLLLSIAVIGCSLTMASASAAATIVTGDTTPLPWSNTTNVYVGETGSGTLAVDAGSQVRPFNAYLGYSSNATGEATVTGAGSQWSNGGSLFVGLEGSGSLLVEAGGEVTSSSGLLGFAAGSSGSVSITGTGSQWTNAYDLYVGREGGGTLHVEAGALVSSYRGYLGSQAGSTGAAIVTGTGSQWTNSSYLHVGREGNGSLTVDDGGEVTAGTLNASLSDLYGDGTITADGAVLDTDLRFDAENPMQFVTNFGSGGTLTVTAGGGDLGAGYNGQGTLTLANGIPVTSSYGYLGYFAGSTGTATITGDGTQWISREDHYVGNEGTGALRVEEGAVVTSLKYGYLGYEAGSTGSAMIAGNGSQWDIRSDLYVGTEGSGTLSVEAGGVVTSRSGYLGHIAGSTGAATITGTGSRWAISRDLFVSRGGRSTLTVADEGVVTVGTLYASLSDLHGDGTIVAAKGAVLDAHLRFDAENPTQFAASFGSGGTLIVTPDGGELGAGYKGQGSLTVADGVAVTINSGYLGYYTGSAGVATITGYESQWIGEDMFVGVQGSGTLCVEEGGVVSSRYGYLGLGPSSVGVATITGTGSQWIGRLDLYVGGNGSGVLRVEEGGVVSSEDGYLGYGPDSTGAATITGTGSQWVIDHYFRFRDSSLYVGHEGSGTLNVEAGGLVSNTHGYLGYKAGSAGSATITGDGSQWDIRTNLYAGTEGSGILHVELGGMVSSSNGFLGYETGSAGAVTITGVGSQWVNSGVLYVGGHGSGSLAVEDGGEVTTGTLYASVSDLYGDGTITAERAVLDGDLRFDTTHPEQMITNFGSGGTLRITGEDLRLGYKGQGSLTVADGIIVTSKNGYLGHEVGSTGAAKVTGAGSQWVNSGALIVGQEGSGTLNVEAGGLVSDSAGNLGYEADSTGAAKVTGAGSRWVNSGFLFIGRAGSGTLDLEAGGLVTNSVGNLGYEAGSTGAAKVTGAGSHWANRVSLIVGRGGSGTLCVEAGGLVSSTRGYLGYEAGSTGSAMITGTGSMWINSDNLIASTGSLNIRNSGLVSVGNSLTIENNSVVNMSTGGMLALIGEAEDSLTQFLDLIDGPWHAIRYWDNTLGDWSPLTAAIFGVDYSLEYLTEGDLMGYTLLTVGEAPLPGDFNSDGLVNGFDFLSWQRGESPNPGSAEDLELWRSQFGAGAGDSTIAAAVPEPSSLPLWLSVGAALLSRMALPPSLRCEWTEKVPK